MKKERYNPYKDEIEEEITPSIAVGLLIDDDFVNTFLSFLKYGHENPTTSYDLLLLLEKYIRKRYGNNFFIIESLVSITSIIERLIVFYNKPIGSTHKGYFIIKSTKDLNVSIKYLKTMKKAHGRPENPPSDRLIALLNMKESTLHRIRYKLKNKKNINNLSNITYSCVSCKKTNLTNNDIDLHWTEDGPICCHCGSDKLLKFIDGKLDIQVNDKKKE